jgi:DNA processing protein
MSTLFSYFFEKINQIAPLESNFTEVLESIAVKPKTLYFYGKMPENVVKNSRSERPKTVAIVGSRRNTRYGEEVAYKLAYELGKRGVVVVSGLAFGIDSISHRGCLDAGGTTVAVLGTRIDKIYPRAHMALASEIIEKGGAIISEYSPNLLEYQEMSLAPGEYLDKQGRRAQDPKGCFLYRNRLISGLADIVVVVEAAERSGSLNTATHALAQGREVFAVPGNITSPYSRGCNKLIAQGALPYTEPDDILRVLFPEDYIKKRRSCSKAKLIGDNDVETAVLKALADGVSSGEDIMKVTLLPPEMFNQAITILEIKGSVRALGMNNWSLT